MRRTDKIGQEAKLHPLEDYMKHAENFYGKMDQKEVSYRRIIYLATDTKSVLAEARNK